MSTTCETCEAGTSGLHAEGCRVTAGQERIDAADLCSSCTVRAVRRALDRRRIERLTDADVETIHAALHARAEACEQAVATLAEGEQRVLREALVQSAAAYRALAKKICDADALEYRS